MNSDERWFPFLGRESPWVLWPIPGSSTIPEVFGAGPRPSHRRRAPSSVDARNEGPNKPEPSLFNSEFELYVHKRLNVVTELDPGSRWTCAPHPFGWYLSHGSLRVWTRVSASRLRWSVSGRVWRYFWVV